MTTMMVAFIFGLIFMAIMGAVCGHFALKLILNIEKSKADRAKQQLDSAPPPTDEQRQA
jgi:F0F1-type ATP synthase membrane subunit b/b'